MSLASQAVKGKCALDGLCPTYQSCMHDIVSYKPGEVIVLMKTIKQMADEIGVGKQQVYRYIRKNRISEAHQKNGVMYYDDAVEAQVIQHFSENGLHQVKHSDALQSASLDAVIEMLKSELDMKNEQIRELHARLAETNAALVTAQQSAHTAQALHAGTMQKHLIDSEAAEAATGVPTEPKGFFSRLFRR